MEKLSEKEKEFMRNVCMECKWLYDCDNNAHEQQWKECMKKF